MVRQPQPTWTSFAEVFRAVLRHKGKATVFFVVTVAVTVIYTLLASRIYRSEATILVRLGRENAVLGTAATAGGGPVVAMPPSREEEINSIAEVLKSRALVEKVVDGIGPRAILDQYLPNEGPPSEQSPLAASGGFSNWLIQARTQVNRLATAGMEILAPLSSTAKLTDREVAIVKCQDNLRVQTARRSNVITVAYDARSPQFAQAVAARFTEVFVDAHTRLHREERSQAFFAAQTDKLREQLSGREEQLRKLKNETGLSAPEEQRRLLVRRIDALEEALLTADASRAVAEAKIAMLRDKLNVLPAAEVSAEVAGVADEGTNRMRGQLYSLQVEEQEYAAKYTEDHPKMRQIRFKIPEAKQLLAAEERTGKQVTTARGRLHEQAQLALLAEEPVLAEMKAKAGQLRSQLASVRSELNRLNENELQIARLQREVDLDDAHFRKYAVGLEQSRIDAALDAQRISNISIIQPASLDPRHIQPRAGLNLAGGLLIGLFGGVGLALLMDCRDRSLRTPEELEQHLALPALAAIPRFTREQLQIDLGTSDHDGNHSTSHVAEKGAAH